MIRKDTILIVDDEEMLKMALKGVLQDEYDIIEADNGKNALNMLHSNAHRVSAIVLDLVMPVMDGAAFLNEFRKYSEYHNIPVLISTSTEDEKLEKKCLELGVWDFVTKPYNPVLLKFRLRNAIEKSRLLIGERDSVTGLYTKTKFYQTVREKLVELNDKKMVFIRLDIDRFKMINNFYGSKEGNRVLQSIAAELIRVSEVFKDFVYGRIQNDIFACCMPFEMDNVDLLVKTIQIRLRKENKDYNIKVSCGVYIIDNNDMDISEMYDRAYLAAKNCKGKYVENISYYNENMIENMRHEQYILNQVETAIREEQFVVFLQPKILLETEEPYGAEALVRWEHPQRGMIFPGDFIPIYERNGLIGKLDQYMWRKVCQLLRRWIDEGKNPMPISVNVSRVNIYNPHLVEVLTSLVSEYKIPARLLNLELTESAFVEDQEFVTQTMKKLHDYGFQIMMDDFGSGYSSLNILKDMDLDYLKIDMKFLQNKEENEKGEKVLTSIIRMAKWMKLPIIIEGVETKEQVNYLRQTGCEYAQGFYYAKPMRIEDYEEYLEMRTPAEYNRVENMEIREEIVLENVSQIAQLIEKIDMPMAIYEFHQKKLALLRSNEKYIEKIGLSGLNVKIKALNGQKIDEKFPLSQALQMYLKKQCSAIEYEKEDGSVYQIKPQIMEKQDDILLLLAIFNDITEFYKP